MKKEEIDCLVKYYLHLLPINIKHTIKYPYLNEEEREIEKAKLSEIIVKNHGNEVFWNLCPMCRKLARTPLAKQCKFCNHTWH